MSKIKNPLNTHLFNHELNYFLYSQSKNDKTMKYKIVLGSASPRRQELLRQLDWDFKTVSIKADETYPNILPATEVPEYLAIKKSLAYDKLKKDELLITADTIVVLDGEILEKPKNKTAAKKMLQALSGKKHEVITGVCLRTKKDILTFADISEVYFKKLKNKDINYYIDRYKPFDKAGAYGIQEWIGLVGIKKIKGSYYNIMGLPTAKLIDYIKECK